jgi:hypothetical protein
VREAKAGKGIWACGFSDVHHLRSGPRRRLSRPDGQSRRQFLRVAAAATAGPFIAEPVGPALADGSVNEALETGLETSAATIFVARKIITMERDNPTATAVAVAGDKILATGSLDQVKAALAGRARRNSSASARPCRSII